MGEEAPISVDKKFRKASGLTALAGFVALTAAGCGNSSRDFQDGQVIDKWHEASREEIGLLGKVLIEWKDDEDWKVQLENCTNPQARQGCEQEIFKVTPEVYSNLQIGQEATLSGEEILHDQDYGGLHPEVVDRP